MCKRFDDAFLWVLWYEDFDACVDEMREYLRKAAEKGDNYVLFPSNAGNDCVTDDDVSYDNPNSILWACLVMMFGGYGTSPMYGWVERTKEAYEWLDARIRATYLIEE